MAMRRRPAWGEYFEDLGKTRAATECSFCHRKNLPGTVLLLAYSHDGEPGGSAYACDGCAADMRRRGVLAKFHGKAQDGDPRLRRQAR